MTHDQYQEFAHASLHELMEKQKKFKQNFGFDGYENWHYNEVTGIFKFINGQQTLHFQFQVVGSLSTKTQTWKWAWDNEYIEEKVKTKTRSIQKFGENNNISELTTGSFESSEEDGWKFTALAAKMCDAAFGYRMPVDHLLLFVIIGDQISTEEVQKIEDRYTECDEHGTGRIAFVCHHLNKNTPTGFHEPFESIPTMELENGQDFQAWCNACEEFSEHEGGWTEKAEEFANVRVVCEGCFFEMKACNQK